MKKILFISGAVGLGHIIRDLAIARELRRRDPEVDISWLGAPTIHQVIREVGEKLHPAAGKWADENPEMERVSKKEKYHVNLIWEVLAILKGRSRNVEIFKEVTRRETFDLVIGDEAYEIHRGILKDSNIKRAPFVYLNDFIGMDSMSKNPLEKLLTYICNREWTKDYGRKNPIADLFFLSGKKRTFRIRSLVFYYLAGENMRASERHNSSAIFFRSNPSNSRTLKGSRKSWVMAKPHSWSAQSGVHPSGNNSSSYAEGRIRS